MRRMMWAAALLCGFLSLNAFADSSSELWQGSLGAGGVKLRLVLHLEKTDDGKYSGTLDSIDQSVNDLPVVVEVYDKDTLKIDIKAVAGSFEGKIGKNGTEVVGTWKQGPSSLPLTLTKGGSVPVILRPQTPKPPFSYGTQEVAFDSKPGVKLAGTLTLPREHATKVPAVVLIAGSGPNNRDEAILNHQIFLVIADYLTKRGFAVLRYDKRGISESSGSYLDATTADFADDAEAGVRYLKMRPEIDAGKIGLIGHSEGGVIAPMVAARNKGIAFIVLMAGTGINGEEILYRQTALISKSYGASDEAIKRNRKMQEKMFAIAKEKPDAVLAKKKMHELIDQQWAELTEAERKATGTSTALYGQGDALISPWMHYFLTYDPVPALRQVRCPVLALNGSKDLQVPPEIDLSKIDAALKAGGNKDYTIKELPGLNHLFQTCTTGSPSEYGNIEETISPVALKTMGDWITAHTHK